MPPMGGTTETTTLGYVADTDAESVVCIIVVVVVVVVVGVRVGQQDLQALHRRATTQDNLSLRSLEDQFY